MSFLFQIEKIEWKATHDMTDMARESFVMTGTAASSALPKAAAPTKKSKKGKKKKSSGCC